MSKLYLGIDVSSRNNVVYLMKPDGSKHSNFSAENSPKGSAELVKQIVKPAEEAITVLEHKRKKKRTHDD